MPMLFLSGATIPAAMPARLGADSSAEFLPATYLVSGFQGIFFRNRNLLPIMLAGCRPRCCSHWCSAFSSRCKLFRWEKEEKMPPRDKLWVLAVLAPFLIMGCCRAYSKEHIGENEALVARPAALRHVILIRNTRMFIGDGKVIENGSVLVHDGKIDGVYEQAQRPTPSKSART